MFIHTYKRLFCLFFIVFLLSGCLYPEQELSKNSVPNEAQLEKVQTAVDQYSKETEGLLPIKTKPNDTPIFRKHLIDFQPLKERNLLSEVPGTAYENGGIYQYTIITPDENPRVKLIDLRIADAIRQITLKLQIYRDENIYPPFGNEISDGVFQLDYKKMGLDKRPQVKSPYSGENLPIVMNTEGKLYVDYRIDLNQALKKYEHDYQKGDDIRYLLAENTPFVPAYSLPYTIQDGEPVFQVSVKNK
ncbi:hypothetical protein [Lentibacillus cibarius]|uniref:ABC transporter periplasmic binding protein yphF n=1 Tax=Lentibacillus cibarius TaxID=2583219 RepID=A0A5S3QFV0_9BACI|nr:hypothetical protein [Lentibacillus cibarius]TMN20687.1 hypothetical protein FFL34_00105 [Lentibacillus cibarius]